MRIAGDVCIVETSSEEGCFGKRAYLFLGHGGVRSATRREDVHRVWVAGGRMRLKFLLHGYCKLC